jgi:hypothetical protein
LDSAAHMPHKRCPCPPFLETSRPRNLSTPPSQPSQSTHPLPKPPAALMSSVYEDHKDDDGFLYITYSGENTFGAGADGGSCQGAELAPRR